MLDIGVPCSRRPVTFALVFFFAISQHCTEVHGGALEDEADDAFSNIKNAAAEDGWDAEGDEEEGGDGEDGEEEGGEDEEGDGEEEGGDGEVGEEGEDGGGGGDGDGEEDEDIGGTRSRGADIADHIAEEFKDFDKDKSGKCNAEELNRAFGSLDGVFKSGTFDWKPFDLDKDGELDLQELVSVARKHWKDWGFDSEMGGNENPDGKDEGDGDGDGDGEDEGDGDGDDEEAEEKELKEAEEALEGDGDYGDGQEEGESDKEQPSKEEL